MSHDYFLTEIASTLDLFFKELTDCGVLISYSLQLQISNTDIEAIVKIRNVVYQFMKNLQILYRKLQSIKIIESNTRNNSTSYSKTDELLLNSDIASDVVVICNPLTFSTVTCEGSGFVVAVEELQCDGKDVHKNSSDLKSNCNSIVRPQSGESGELHLGYNKNGCTDNSNIKTSLNATHKFSKLYRGTDSSNIKCVIIPSTVSREDENKRNLLHNSLNNKPGKCSYEIKRKDSSSQNSWKKKALDNVIVKSNVSNVSDDVFHVIVGSSSETSCSSPKRDKLRKWNDSKNISLNSNVNNEMCTENEVKQELNSQQFKLQCCICSLKFISPEKLKEHCHVVHVDIEYFICLKCDKMFITNRDFQRHNNEFHDITNQFKCEVCNKRISTKLSLSRHMNIHGGKKTAVCNICGKAFTRSDYLVEHRKIHLGKQIFGCKLCPKRFSRKTHLKVHEKVHSGTKDHVCNICSKGFTRSDKLKEHMMRHLNIKRFQCSICNKYYAENRDLKIHIKSHN